MDELDYLYYKAEREHSDFIIQMIELAIEDGFFKYQLHVTDKKYAPEIFLNMVRPCIDEGTVMLAACKACMAGFACYRVTKFCGNEFCDGMMTYVDKRCRGDGVSKQLRKRLFDKEKMCGKIVRYTVESGNYIGFVSAVNAAKQVGVKIRCTGQTYEGIIS